MAKAVKAGDKVLQHLTASWFNEQNKQRNKGHTRTPISPENPIRVRCIAGIGTDLARFDPAYVSGPAIDYEDFDGSAVQYNSLSVIVGDSITPERWGIVQGPCYANHPSYITLFGITWANFEYTPTDQYVDVIDGELVSSTSGRGFILSPPEAEGLPGLIMIQHPTSEPLRLRISGFDYQLSRDGGTTWETWATGAACP